MSLSFLVFTIFVFTSDVTASLTISESATCLSAFNTLRRLHQNTVDLQWDSSLASRAQSFAEHIKQTNIADGKSALLFYEHPADDMGETLYYRMSTKKAKCAQAVLSWYSEFDNYDYNNDASKNGREIGAFTQVVWASTTKVGVGIATTQNSDGMFNTYIVAKYVSQGNLYNVGQKHEVYTENVKPRKPGASTPSVEDLDPSLIQACINEHGDAECETILNRYQCKGNYEAFLKLNCYKSCGYC